MSPKAFRSSPLRPIRVSVPGSSDEESDDEPNDPPVEMHFTVHFGGFECDIKFTEFPNMDGLKFAIHVKFPGVPPPNQRIWNMVDPDPDGCNSVEMLDIGPSVYNQRHCLDLLEFNIWVDDTRAHEVMSITILSLEEPNIADMTIQFTPDQTIGYMKVFYMMATGREGVKFHLQEGGDVSGTPTRFGSPWLFTDDAATLQGCGISSGSVLIADLEDLVD